MPYTVDVLGPIRLFF